MIKSLLHLPFLLIILYIQEARAEKFDLIAGDILQITNPLTSTYIASKEKGIGHFAIIYAQNMAATYATKYTGTKTKWNISKRPNSNKYDGMPSGHTSSAWSSASYVRTFSNDYKYVAIPLYIGAAITAYSRINHKKHTSAQVISAAALTEIITYANSKLGWSNHYRSTNFTFDEKGFMAGASIKF